ncbi:MAG TPA: alpha/beta hydrolase [Gemmatimonadaceae bacterium]|jgi:pimeloyl-ACP methyl ester carboxylesterase|nr:alpha/beta hydrolase [Gemmatimonadaceae bacterium]
MLTATTLAGDLTAMRLDVPASTRPPILFIHGLFGGAWQFEALQCWFADHGYSSVAINLRGHHASRPVPDIGNVSVLEYVDDALGAARDMARPIVFGHSMGGFIAQKLAECDAVCAAVLVCAAPPGGISVVSPSLFVRQMKHAPSILFSRPLIMDRADADALVFNCVPPERHAALFARFVPDSGRVGRELTLGAVAVDERRVRCPVASIAATEDRFVVPRVARALAQKYRGAYREFEEHGHYIIAEPGWDVMAEEIESWLSQHALVANDA